MVLEGQIDDALPWIAEGYLNGTYCHKTGTKTPSYNTTRQPTVYLCVKTSSFLFLFILSLLYVGSCYQIYTFFIFYSFFLSIFLCVCIYPFPSPSLLFSYVKIILKRRIYYYGKTETFLTFAPPTKKNKKEEICENRMWHVKMFYLSMNDHSNSNNAKLGSSTINFFSYSYSTMYLWQVWFRWKITFTLA